MQKTKSGFTIVELLIVIVVIAILAAISIVAYNGVQERVRNSQRLNDIAAIQKALELYKVDNGTYPPTSATTSPQNTCAGIATGYSYSWAPDNSWLRPLVDEGYLAQVPVSPKNNCTSYYRYLRVSATGYSCTTRTSDYYVLAVIGAEGTNPPSNSATFKPCPESSMVWGASNSTWIFTKDDN